MQLFTLLFDLFLFLFGTLSVVGILHFEFEKFFSVMALTKIGTTCVLLIYVLVFLISQTATFRCLYVFAVVGCLYIGLQLYIKYLEKRMLNDVHSYIKNVIMQMKMGASFRLSIEHAVVYEQSKFMQTWLQKIYENVVFTQHKTTHFKSKMLIKLVSELKRADESPHLAFQRLENLYSWLKIQSDFRRKSGKVLSQVRFQACFIVVLYIAVTIFIYRYVGSEELLKVFPLSLGLMVLGLFSVFYFGRKMKWNL